MGSLRRAADATRLPLSNWKRWSAGGNDPPLSALLALADAAGVNRLWLVLGDGPMEGSEPLPALDEQLLVEVVEVVEAFLRERRAALPPASKARAIVAGYADAVDRKGVDREALYRLLRIAFAL